MRNAAICENESSAEPRANPERLSSRIQFRVVPWLILLAGTASISGCTGVTGAQKTSTQQTQNSSSPAAISVSPASIAFGSVAMNGTVSQSITITNGGGSSLTVMQATAPAGGFTASGASFPVTIAPGQQSNLNIAFSPKTAGAFSGNVSVLSDVSSTPSTVSVTGTGVAATTLLNANVNNLNFGNVNSGASSTLPVTLSNAGNSNVTISSVTPAGAKLTTSGVSAGLILAPGQSATLDVTFSPVAAGSLSGSVTVASNATNSPEIISISGTGVVQAVPHSVSLTWVASSSTVAGYNVYRSPNSGGPYTMQNSTTVAALEYTDSTVQSGQIYYYVVTSVTSAGIESSDSNQVSAVIPTP